MRKSFQYRAKLSRSVHKKAAGQLSLCAELYNAALQERITAYKMAGVSVTKGMQSRQLPEIKKIRPEYKEVGSQVLQNVIERLDKAFKGFFRRIKAGYNPGYPRFRARRRYDSLTFTQAGWKLDGTYLTLHGIGRLKLILSRPIEGQVKTVTLKRDRCDDWFVTFACDDVPEKVLSVVCQKIGIDVGLEKFLTASDGQLVKNPRYLRHAEAAIKRTQRRVSKRKKGSNRRRSMVKTLARKHRKVQRARRDFHFKTAREIVQQYDTIAVENLSILGLSRGMLSKNVHDAGWGQFIEILSFKAAEAGRELIKVNPKGTSQICSGCEHEPKERKKLSDRVHKCLECGLVLDRDVNAARNILALADAEKRVRAGPSASRPASKVAA